MSTNGESEDIDPSDPVSAVSGVGDSRSQTLRDAGYSTVRDLQQASVTELDAHLPTHVAQDIKSIVGNGVGPVTSIAEAKDRARDIPGAKAKVVRQNGQQVAKVLEKVQEQQLAGAHVEIHKG